MDNQYLLKAIFLAGSKILFQFCWKVQQQFPQVQNLKE